MLARVRSGGTQGRFTEQANALRLQIRDGGVHIIDVEGEMVTSDVAVLGRLHPLSGCFILKDLEVRTVFAAEEAQLAHDGARVDVQMCRHPVAVGQELTDLENIVAADHVDKESGGLLEVGHGKADMLGSA